MIDAGIDESRDELWLIVLHDCQDRAAKPVGDGSQSDAFIRIGPVQAGDNQFAFRLMMQIGRFREGTETFNDHDSPIKQKACKEMFSSVLRVDQDRSLPLWFLDTKMHRPLARLKS